jgi:methionine sulfoxide reductase heme-binding subunit
MVWMAGHTLLVATFIAVMVWANASAYELMAANPAQFLQRATGKSALYCLILTLCITPLRRLSGQVGIVRFRRTLGLLCFALATVHLGTFLVLDHGFDFADISVDILKRPLILLGLLAFTLLLPLAATSTATAKRWLGGRRWKRLHQLIYPASILAVAHYYALKKVDLTQPLVCGVVLAILLIWRVDRYWRPAGSKPE